MWLLASPLSLLALAAIPAVVGIYLFRIRARRREVSSLFLWVDSHQSKHGGQKLQKLQTPLLLLLELLVLALIALAAAAPFLRREHRTHSSVVILDSSYSMTAPGVQESAQKSLQTFLESEAGFPLQFILAKAKPETFGSRFYNPQEAINAIGDWKCNSETADLQAAISFAAKISPDDAKFLVITDHAPPEPIGEGKIQWKSFGKPADNLAIVHASRVLQGDKDRLLAEIANLSPQPQRMQLAVLDPRNNAVLFQVDELIEGNSLYRLRSTIPGVAEAIELRLGADALECDNRTVLLSPSKRPVRVSADSLPIPFKKAIEATGLGKIVDERADITFANDDSIWNIRLISVSDKSAKHSEFPEGENGKPATTGANEAGGAAVHTDFGIQGFLGPFVVDRSHVLTSGVFLDGIVWGASPKAEMQGFPIISAGNVPLLTEQTRLNGTKIISVQWNPSQSTLLQSPCFPVLIWNIMKYYSEFSDGVSPNLVRLGGEAMLRSSADKSASVKSPSGEKRQITLRSGLASVPADEIGVYSLQTESGEHLFSVGALSQSESDLTKALSGQYGGWLDEKTLHADYRTVAWIFLLASIVAMCLHWGIISGGKAKYASNRQKLV